jgi:hypothetical protein
MIKPAVRQHRAAIIQNRSFCIFWHMAVMNEIKIDAARNTALPIIKNG